MKLSTTFRASGCEIKYYTNHSNAFSISNEGMMKISTEDPVCGIDYLYLSDGYYLKITSVDLV